MRQFYAAISSIIIHFVCALGVYSLWYSVEDIPVVQAAESRVIDIGMLQAVEQSTELQSGQTEESHALASVETPPSQESNETTTVKTITEEDTSADTQVEKTVPEAHSETVKEATTPAVANKTAQKNKSEPKTQTTPKPSVKKTEVKQKPPQKTTKKPATQANNVATQNSHQANSGSGLANNNQIKQQGKTLKSQGGQGQQQKGQGASYLSVLLNTISKRAAQSYPQQARQMRHEGKARVAFTLLDDGRFSDIRLLQSSGHHSLDQAALSTLRRIGKHSAPPPDVNRHISTTIVFTLKR